MKKLYFLWVALMVTGLSYGQEMLVNGDFEAWDDATTPTGWTHVESVDQEATEIHGGTYSAKHTGGTSDLGQTIAGITPGDQFTLTVWYKFTENDETDVRLWSKWKNGSSTVDGGDNALIQTYFNANGGVWTEYTVNLTAPATATSFYFEIRTYSGVVAYLDDFSFLKTAGSSCNLILEEPTTSCDAETVNTDTYTVEIPFTGGGTETFTITPDSGSVSGDDPTSNASGTIIINGVSEGTDLHVDVTSTGCDLDVNATSPVCYPATTGVPVITGVVDGTLASDGCSGTSGSSNPKFIEIYVNGTVNFTGYSMENESNGAVDSASENWYSNDISALGVKTDEFVYLVPAGETTFVEMYPDATYITAGPSGNGNDAFRVVDPSSTVIDQFGTPTDITDGGYGAAWVYQDSYARRNSTDTANAGTFDVANWTIGEDNEFDAPNNTCEYISGAYPISINKHNEINSFSLFPNPVTNGMLTINTQDNLEKNVQIFDVLGKQVFTKTTSTSTINVSNLNAGIYIIRVEEAGRLATRKLVVE